MQYIEPVSDKNVSRNVKNYRLAIYLIIYRICLDAIYFGMLTGLYSYGGYKNNWNIISCLTSWVITATFIMLSRRLFNKEKHRLSDYVVLFLIIIIAFPSTTMISAGVFTTSFIIIDTFFWVWLISLQVYISRKSIRPIVLKIGESVFDDKIIYVFAIISFALVIYINLRYTHFRISFDIYDAYDFRAQAREYSFPTIIRYGFCWSRAINNCMIAYCLSKRKFPTVILFIIAQVLSFSIDGLKSTLFLPIIIIGIFILYTKRPTARFFNYVLNIISGLCVAGVIENRIFHTANITLVFIRRVFFTPVVLNSYYVDFFSNNPPVYYRTLFGIPSPYTELGRMIGGIYANRPNMNCNNGLLGDAMINFGIVGVFVFPILLIMILWLIDRFSDGLDKLIIVPIAYYFATTLSNSVITTALGTHGLLILSIIFLLMRGSGKSYLNRRINTA